MPGARTTTMRNPLHLSLAVLILLPVFHPHPVEAQQACAQPWARDGLHLSGRLNGEEIRGYLNTGYPAQADNGVSGVFLYPDRWKPTDVGSGTVLSVEGTLADDCAMVLQDPDGGTWRLRFVTSERLEGARTGADSGATSFSLRMVAATDCEANGTWRTFSASGWPVTFDYPASWRVAEDRTNVVIDCPSAERLAWGGSSISLTVGSGREHVVSEDGRSGTRIGPFFTFGDDDWLVGQCGEAGPGIYCRPARRSEWKGMTVLQGSAGEHRRYRAGGGAYVGQGAGIMSYVFVLGDAWVEIESEDTPDSIEQMGSAGPVVFDGAGVTERLVRSIKAK